VRNLTHESIAPFTATLVVYFLLSLVLIAGMKLLERFIAYRVGVAQGRERA